MDPSAETYDAWTPYNYCADNPINLVDFNGMDWYVNDTSGALQWYDGTYEDDNIPEGYSYLGTDDFFGETGTDVIRIMKNKLKDENSEGDIVLFNLEADVSESIANFAGFKKVPGSILQAEFSSTAIASGQGGDLSVTSTTAVEVVKSYTYTENKNIEIDSKVIEILIDEPAVGPMNSVYVSNRNLIYGQKTNLQKLVDVLIVINNIRSGNISTPPVKYRYPSLNSVPEKFDFLKSIK